MMAAEGVQTTILPIGKDMGKVGLRFNRMQSVHKKTHNVCPPFFFKEIEPKCLPQSTGMSDNQLESHGKS